MDDADVLGQINELAREEHTLWAKEGSGEASDADRLRLRWIQGTLDRYWDYRNQRRALLAAGRDPDDAQLRDATAIERYVR